MKNDKTTQAMCAALNPQLQNIANEIDKCKLLSRVDELPEEILDQLAYELHIDWYDINAQIDAKRRIVKNSDKVHMFLGTAFAIEQVVQDYFGDGTVEDWYEYSGNPPYFRIVTTNPSITSDEADRFAMAIEKVKRGTSRLEAIVLTMAGDLASNFCFIVHTGDVYTVEQVV